MSILHESSEATDRRMRRVLCNADVRSFGVPYAFFEFPLQSVSPAFADALALIRDDQKWSVLQPTTVAGLHEAAERFWVFRIQFPPDVDNSGFVGWLASHFKSVLGAGVFVVCGFNADRGGVYYYWGLPYEIKERGRQLLSDLGGTIPAEGVAQASVEPSCTSSAAVCHPSDAKPSRSSSIYIGDLTMAPISASDCSVVSTQTRLRFEQRGDIIYAKYKGSPISEGYLLGRIRENVVSFQYMQVTEDGVLDSGVSAGSLFYCDGRLRLREDYRWLTRPGAGTNIYEVCATD